MLPGQPQAPPGHLVFLPSFQEWFGAVRLRIRPFALQGCQWRGGEVTLNLWVRVENSHINKTAPQALLASIRGQTIPDLGSQGPRAALGLRLELERNDLSSSFGSIQVPPGLERLPGRSQSPAEQRLPVALPV